MPRRTSGDTFVPQRTLRAPPAATGRTRHLPDAPPLTPESAGQTNFLLRPRGFFGRYECLNLQRDPREKFPRRTVCVAPRGLSDRRITQMLSGTQKAYGPPDPHDNRHQSANKRNLTIAVVVCGKAAKCHRGTRRSNPFLAGVASCGWVAHLHRSTGYRPSAQNVKVIFLSLDILLDSVSPC